MLAIIAWALRKRVLTACQWAIIGGLLVSFASGLPYFVPLISYLLTVGLTLLLRQRVWQVPILAMLIAVFAGTILQHTLSVIALTINGVPIPILQSLNIITLPSLILNLLLAVPMYALMGELAKLLYPEVLEV